MWILWIRSHETELVSKSLHSHESLEAQNPQIIIFGPFCGGKVTREFFYCAVLDGIVPLVALGRWR